MNLQEYVSGKQLDLLTMKLNELDFPVRASNVFNRNGFETVMDLIIYTGGDYRSLRHIGQNLSDEISTKLNQLGIDVENFSALTIHSLPISLESKRHLLKAQIFYKEDLVGMNGEELFSYLKEAHPTTNPRLLYEMAEEIFQCLGKTHFSDSPKEESMIFEVKLPKRTGRLLVNNNMFFWRDVMKCSKKKLRELPEFGSKEMRHIERISPNLLEDFESYF